MQQHSISFRLSKFIFSASFTESKFTDINKILLKQALQNSGNVTVLMDRFDEISPFRMQKAFAILYELVYTKAGRYLVTFRNVQKERLEKEPCGITLSTKNLSHESQR